MNGGRTLRSASASVVVPAARPRLPGNGVRNQSDERRVPVKRGRLRYAARVYREPPAICAVCGDAIDAHDADVIETGLRCPRCTEAADMAARRPALEAAREAQAAWRALAAERNKPGPRLRTCRRHAEWDTRCLWCVLANPFGTEHDIDD